MARLHTDALWILVAVALAGCRQPPNSRVDTRPPMVPGSPSDDRKINGPQADQAIALAQRLAAAETVITGTVTSVKPLETPPGRISMHSPEWWQATVTVETVEKGTVRDKSIDVLFPSSEDIQWARSPKIKEGDQRVFLLHKQDPYGQPTPGLAVVDPLDSLPTSELPKLRPLLKNR